MRQRLRGDIEGRELRPRPGGGRTAPIDERPRNRSSRIDPEMARDRCGHRNPTAESTATSGTLSCGRWRVSDRSTSCPRSVYLDACRSNATGCGSIPHRGNLRSSNEVTIGRRRELERPDPILVVASWPAGWLPKWVKPGGRFDRSNSGSAKTSPPHQFPSVNCRDAYIQRRTVILSEGGSLPTPHCRNGRQIQRRMSPSTTSDCTPVERLSRGTTPRVKTGRTGLQKYINTVFLETNKIGAL
jgi:hypothetical protein